MGAPLAVLFTPLAFLLVGQSLKLLPGGEPALSFLIETGTFIFRAIEATDSEDPASLLTPDMLLALVLLLAPGMAMLLMVWFFLKRRFEREGVGGLLLTLSARKPHPSDVEEIQLANVVEEMAIAASLPPPAVLIHDDEAPNAAAVGSSEREATVVVSRGIMARLDRDETQAVVGHLVGSIGSGDLRILGGLNAVFERAGLVLLVLDSVFQLSPSAMRDLARVLRFVFGARTHPREASEVEKLLVVSSHEVRGDGVLKLSESRVVKRLPFLYVFLMPFLLTSLVALLLGWQTWLIRSVFVGPIVMLVWRNHRYHADALAVRLTRNPDALARALTSLSMSRGLVERMPWCEPLFVVGASSGGWSDQLGGYSVRSHPPLEKRLKRIAAMGGIDLSRPRHPWRQREVGLGSIVFLPVAALIFVLLGIAVGLSFLLAAFLALMMTVTGLVIVMAILS